MISFINRDRKWKLGTQKMSENGTYHFHNHKISSIWSWILIFPNIRWTWALVNCISQNLKGPFWPIYWEKVSWYLSASLCGHMEHFQESIAKNIRCGEKRQKGVMPFWKYIFCNFLSFILSRPSSWGPKKDPWANLFIVEYVWICFAMSHIISEFIPYQTSRNIERLME